jgi:pyruvate dehydrogenase E2 component (dihydrolipoamide acetyltransferase)
VARVALEIPKVGLVMENARLVRWLKQVGEIVRQGEPLLELETEKSVVEIESTASGRLVEILLHADQEASVGDRVAWLEVEADTAVAAEGPAITDSVTVADRTVARGATEAPGPSAAQTQANARVKSSPVARRLAAEHAVDLRRIVGTGPRGRVQLVDVRRALESRSTPGNAQPLSSMRRALARSMTLSNATIPQFNVERAVDWSTLQSVRERFVAQLPPGLPRPSINDFLLQGIARTLLSIPALNTTFLGDANSPEATIVTASGTHIGLAVAVDNGLLVPVLHNVEQLGMAELARRRADTVERALKGRLRRDELEGATFSLSNLGAGGPDRFTALINPPQSAILAVGRQRDCVVARDGQIHIKPMSQLTLTVDHRIADGRLASTFLQALVEILESETWHLS